nr:hypothetical protein [Tanacetum cinerariifolium]
RLKDEAQAENEDLLNKLDENIQKIIKEKVKAQVSKILPKIENTINEQLKAEVLTHLSNSFNTSHVVAANLTELELKKILIEKMERVQEKMSQKEPESTSATKEKTSKKTGKSTEGSKSHHKSAPAEEPIHTTKYLEELTHQEFDTGATDDQPVEEASQHPDLFQKQAKPSTLDHAWNKTLLATHGPIQPWIRNLAKKDDFSAFVMNRLKVDTLTPELLVGLTYELMKCS